MTYHYIVFSEPLNYEVIVCSKGNLNCTTLITNVNFWKFFSYTYSDILYQKCFLAIHLTLEFSWFFMVCLYDSQNKAPWAEVLMRKYCLKCLRRLVAVAEYWYLLPPSIVRVNVLCETDGKIIITQINWKKVFLSSLYTLIYICMYIYIYI